MRCDLQVDSNGRFKEILPFHSVCGSHLDRGQREYSQRDRWREAAGDYPSVAFSISHPPRTPAFDSEQFVGGFCSARVLGRLTSHPFRFRNSLLTSKTDFRSDFGGRGGLLERFKDVN